YGSNASATTTLSIVNRVIDGILNFVFEVAAIAFAEKSFNIETDKEDFGSRVVYMIKQDGVALLVLIIDFVALCLAGFILLGIFWGFILIGERFSKCCESDFLENFFKRKTKEQQVA
ncbi:17205_t:CDS:2, partial [Racocetra persica]